jgi:hypothetical protein
MQSVTAEIRSSPLADAVQRETNGIADKIIGAFMILILFSVFLQNYKIFLTTDPDGVFRF